MKCRARVRQKVGGVDEVTDSSVWNLFQNEAKETVVGAHKQVSRRLNQNWATIRSNPGVDDCKVDRTSREMGVSRTQRERCSPDILRRDRVSDIDQNRRWTARQDNSLHCTDEVVFRSEVG